MGRWLTPDAYGGSDESCAIVRVPADTNYRAVVSGALLPLTFPENWEAEGDLSPQEAAAIFADVYDAFLASWSDCT